MDVHGLKKEHKGELTYYESAARHLNKDVLQTHNLEEGELYLVLEMVELIFEWVSENHTGRRTTRSFNLISWRQQPSRPHMDYIG